jgi:hypothetical protein
LVGISGLASAQTAWTKPVPKADCGPNDRVETGLQGETTPEDRISGRSELGYNCNLELVGQHQGEGQWWFGGGNWTSYGDCTYYSTRGHALMTNPGAVVIDASNPKNPRATKYLSDSIAFRSSHEALKVHEKRGLLAANQSSPNVGPGFSVYDISGDCRHPVKLADLDIGGVMSPPTIGHAGNFTPDGYTYYSTNPFQGDGDRMQVIDMFDPANPKLIVDWKFPAVNGPDTGIPHDPFFNVHGTRLYSPQGGRPSTVGQPESPGNPQIGRPNGLVILDVSEIQFRRPNPKIHVISTMFWEDGGTAQSIYPYTYKGKDYLVFADENNYAGNPQLSCEAGFPAAGFARIIDISDETQPKLIAKLKLEVHDVANCAQILRSPITNSQSKYDAHYCTPDRDRNPRLMACNYFASGLRVFDIRDPYHPREVAYYKPPAQRTKFLPGSNVWAENNPDRTVDFNASDIRWKKHKGEMHLWFSSADNGFQIVRFTNGVIENILAKDAATKAQRAIDGIDNDDE